MRAGIGVGVLGAAALALLAGAPALAQPEPPTSPDDVPEPTPQQLARSVRVWDPGGSVRVWDPAGSVSTLETETTEGDDTVVTLDTDILFEFGSADIPLAAVDRIAELVTEVPQGAEVSVDGHTDSIGDEASNQTLSEQRAEAVAAVIRQSRADLQPVVAGHGESQPVAPNERGGEDNPEGRAQNRRVEIRFTP